MTVSLFVELKIVFGFLGFFFMDISYAALSSSLMLLNIGCDVETDIEVRYNYDQLKTYALITQTYS